MALTRQQKAEAQAAFRGEVPGHAPCAHCGGLHQRACNRVKRQEWHPNGNLVVLEFWPEWKQPGVIWPEDAWDPDDPEDANGR